MRWSTHIETGPHCGKNNMIDKVVTLRILLEEMEQNLGLGGLSTSEKNVYFAAQDVKSSEGVAETKLIIEHKLVTGMSRPTFFRALKSVQKLGLMRHTDRKKTGEFEVL